MNVIFSGISTFMLRILVIYIICQVLEASVDDPYRLLEIFVVSLISCDYLLPVPLVNID